MSLPSGLFSNIRIRTTSGGLQIHDNTLGKTALVFFVNATTRSVQINGLLRTPIFAVGLGAPEQPPGVISYLYGNDASTTPQILIEQGGIGDAALRFLLSGGKSYTMGIDNSQIGNPLKIASGNTLGASDVFFLDEIDCNIGIGLAALDSVIPTSGINNVAMGNNALTAITTGDNNVSVGCESGKAIVAGIGNTLVGYNAGSALTASDSNNIDIGHIGVVGDNATIRLGTEGIHSCTYLVGSQSWLDEQYATPLTGTTVTILNTRSVIIIDPAGTLAALTIEMPAAPKDGQIIKITITQIITSMTHNALGGKTLLAPFGASTTANESGTWYYRASDNTWYRVDNPSGGGGGGGGSGDVVGTPTTTTNAIALYTDTTGLLIKNSVLTVDASGDIDKSGADFLHERGGAGNLGLGSAALDDIEAGGTNNTAIGQNALSALTTGDDNTAIGFNALNTITVSGSCTAVGFEALEKTTSGSGNVALGGIAMNKNTIGGDNTAVGVGALANSDSGSRNIAIGSLSLITNTTGSDNIGIGAFSMIHNNTGSRNIGIGIHSFIIPTAGEMNDIISVGYNALHLNEADELLAIGNNALASNVAGLRMVAIGHNALTVATTGDDDNVAVGHSALAACLGPNNTALGSGAGDVFTTGSNNIVIGKDAGNVLATSDSNNIDIGHVGVAGDNGVVRLGTSGTHDGYVELNTISKINTTGKLEIQSAATGTQIQTGATANDKIGFFGTVPIIQPTPSGNAAAIHAALLALGIFGISPP